MNLINIFGIITSQVGFTFGALASFSHSSLINVYFGFGVWIIGILLLFYEENPNSEEK